MKIWKYLLGLLVLATTTTWLVVLTFPENNLRLIACDVGQGDAILATYGSIQILIDGGPNGKVLECLSRHMPFWDREIELIISTHPDKDHFGGLINVIGKYKIDLWFEGEGESSSGEYQVLKKEVGSRGIGTMEAVNTSNLRVGLIYLDILNDFEKISKDSTNENSIVILLRYRDFKAILTGDALSEDLVDDVKNNQINSVNYIKISHHGSKTGTNKELLELLEPKIAAISVGKNSYGHPQKEVLDLLKEENIKILRTDEKGDIEIISDGEKVWEQ
jgi:competence protein ComEC